ncbi:DUF6807 domain-containing protein [Neolewinella aurantiaca]|nr:PmoA family protein [Neolewinella aurantiaca]
MIHRYIFLCSFILFLASCGPAQENKGEESTGTLHLEQTTDYLRIMNGDQPVLNYWLTPQLPDGLPEHYTRSGFIHPIHSPSGQVVSDGFPAGYAHQNGFFSAWTNTTFRDSFVDFWNTHKELATLRNQEIVETVKEDGIIGFKARIDHLSNAHGLILAEELTVRVHDRDDVFVWDVRSEQTNITEDTLILNKHLYGGLGVRGSKYWNAKDTTNFMGLADFLTSDGLTRDSANHTHPEWTAIYGDLPGGKAGMAVIPHPENFRWPVGVRVHPDLPYFSVSPITEKAAFIAPGQTYLARYRVVVFDGEVPVDLLSSF